MLHPAISASSPRASFQLQRVFSCIFPVLAEIRRTIRAAEYDLLQVICRDWLAHVSADFVAGHDAVIKRIWFDDGVRRTVWSICAVCADERGTPTNNVSVTTASNVLLILFLSCELFCFPDCRVSPDFSCGGSFYHLLQSKFHADKEHE
jgi:hypothetical protein